VCSCWFSTSNKNIWIHWLCRDKNEEVHKKCLKARKAFINDTLCSK
jgi:hypothetical protein